MGAMRLLHAHPGTDPRPPGPRPSGGLGGVEGQDSQIPSMRTRRATAALNYGVRWLPVRHAIRWAADVFPAEVEVPGWRLQLTETRLKAWPGDRFYDEGAARADLEPLLHGWAASAEVVDQVRMETFFLDAEMKAIAAVSMYATARMQVGSSDFGAAREDMSV